jgi:hypothetical protein
MFSGLAQNRGNKKSKNQKLFSTVISLIVSLLIFFESCQVYAQEAPSDHWPHLQVSLPLVDIPFILSDGRYVASMRQSVDFSKSYYQTTYPLLVRGLGLGESKISGHRLLAGGTLLVAYALVSSYLPLGDTWVHEEYHRAVLKNRGVDSFDDVYNLKIFTDSIAVSHVKDEALIELKRKYPHDLIRSHAAGYEGDNQLISALEKDAFFLGTSPAGFVVAFNVINDYLYIDASASDDADIFTSEMNQAEGSIAVRDFTGLDFTAWVYDLFRPEEDYTARGIHPSGVGIDRYIKFSDLSEEEKQFLKKQHRLSLFNFVNRVFITAKSRNVQIAGKEFTFNVRPIHYLTSFGYAVNTDFFIKTSDLNLFLSLQSQFNHDRYFPGIDLEIIRHPVHLFGKDFIVTPRVAVWLQPKDQKFRTSESEPGTLLSVKADYPLRKGYSTYMEIEGKTPGWVAGNVYLDSNVSMRTGISRIF